MVPALRFPEFRDKGEWKVKTFDDLFTIGNGRDYKHLASGDVPVYGSGGYMLSVNDYLYDGESVCIGRKGTIDNPIFLTGKFWTVDTLFYTHSFRDCLPTFIYAIFQQIIWANHNEAGGVPSLSKTNIGKIQVAVPKPDEQQKIADCLTSIDELITAQTQKLDALKNHKNGLMLQLFPRDGETVPQRRFPEFRDMGEWESKPLAKVCNVLQGYGFPEMLQGKNEGKYPFCKVSDISRAVAENGGLLDEAINFVGDDELLKLRAKLIPKGATVFAKIGEALRLNRRAYVQKECLIDNNATGLKAIDGVTDDYFVYLLSQLIDLNKHCGGAVPSVNKSTLEEIEVVVPGSDEQKRIADSLASLDDLITAQTQKIDALKIHKKGLMQQLFPALTKE